MNLLAHAVLSFHEPDLLVGQMISDYVKGRRQFDYPVGIRQGITLHRQIDTFTDAHPVIAEAKEFFRADYRLYSGAFVDVSFDHFLALRKEEFVPGDLFTFSQQVYAVLGRHTMHMPPAFARMFPHMQRHNWLAGYAEREGIHRSFEGLVHRAAYIDSSTRAAAVFDMNYEALGRHFDLFWPQLKDFVKTEISRIKQ
jgi:acyl carrier protein phosphodiesterase